MRTRLVSIFLSVCIVVFLSYNADGVVICDTPYDYAITQQPVGGMVSLGGSWVFTVGYSSTQPPPHYFQWKHNGFDIPGATSSTLVIDPVTVDNVGLYSVRVYGSGLACGSATSIEAELSTGLAIATEPVGGWKEVGDPLSLSVQIIGAVGNVTYQWVHDDVDIPGATGAVYAVASLTAGDAGWYFCRVTDDSKATIESDKVEIVVFQAGALPVSAFAGLVAVAASLAGCGVMAIRKRKSSRN